MDRTCFRHEGKLFVVNLIGKWVCVESSMILVVEVDIVAGFEVILKCTV